MRTRITESSILFISIVKWIVLATIAGAIVGLATTLFLKALGWATGLNGQLPFLFLFLPFALFLSSLMVMYLAPDAEGHGTEKVIEAVHKRSGKIAPIVGIGDDFGATLLTVAMLQQIEVKRIIVHGTTTVHERILNHLGIKEVILPAAEAAERLANTLMFERIMDSFELSSDFTIVEVAAPETLIGQSLQKLDLQKELGMSLITIKRTEKRKGILGLSSRTVERVLGIPTPETTIERGDVLVLFGNKKDIERILRS